MDPSEVSKLIEAGIPDATVRVASADNTHFEALVVSETFAGKRPLARHQVVYACLGNLVGNEIHALSITALTPAEVQERNGAT
jgi:acid stress-induced BolA-like protein IbaG/YrbA